MVSNISQKRGVLAYLFNTNSMCACDEKLYFSANNYDALVTINLNDFSCQIESHFCEMNQTSYYAHAKIIHYHTNIYCIPRYSTNIIKYNLATKEVKKIPIHNLEDNRSLFTEAILIGKKIVCIPEFFPWIISINLETDEVEYVKEITDIKKDTYIFAFNAAIRKNEVMIPFYSKNQLMIMDSNNFITKRTLPIKAAGCSAIAITDAFLCVIGTDDICYVISHSEDQAVEINEIQGDMLVLNNVVWVLNRNKHKIYIIKYENGVQWEEYRIQNVDLILENSEWIKNIVYQEYIFLLFQDGNGQAGLFIFNENKEYCKWLSVEKLYNDFLKGNKIYQEHRDTILPIRDITFCTEKCKQETEQNMGEKIYRATGGR